MPNTQRRHLKQESKLDMTPRQGFQTPFSVVTYLHSLPGRAAITLMRFTHDWIDALTHKQQESRWRQIQTLAFRQRLAALQHRHKYLKNKEHLLVESDEEALSSLRASDKTQPATLQKQLVLSNDMVRLLQKEIDQLSENKQKLSEEYETLLHDFDGLTEDSLSLELSQCTPKAYENLVFEIKQLTALFSDQITSMDRMLIQHQSALTRPNAPAPFSNTDKSLLPPPPDLRLNKLRDLMASSRKRQEDSLLQKIQPLDMQLCPKPGTNNDLINKKRTTDFLSHLATLKNLVQLHQCRTMCFYDANNIHQLQNTLHPASPVPRPKVKAPSEETTSLSCAFK